MTDLWICGLHSTLGEKVCDPPKSGSSGAESSGMRCASCESHHAVRKFQVSFSLWLVEPVTRLIWDLALGLRKLLK